MIENTTIKNLLNQMGYTTTDSLIDFAKGAINDNLNEIILGVATPSEIIETYFENNKEEIAEIILSDFMDNDDIDSGWKLEVEAYSVDLLSEMTVSGHFTIKSLINHLSKGEVRVVDCAEDEVYLIVRRPNVETLILG